MIQNPCLAHRNAAWAGDAASSAPSSHFGTRTRVGLARLLRRLLQRREKPRADGAGGSRGAALRGATLGLGFGCGACCVCTLCCCCCCCGSGGGAGCADHWRDRNVNLLHNIDKGSRLLYSCGHRQHGRCRRRRGLEEWNWSYRHAQSRRLKSRWPSDLRGTHHCCRLWRTKRTEFLNKQRKERKKRETRAADCVNSLNAPMNIAQPACSVVMASEHMSMRVRKIGDCRNKLLVNRLIAHRGWLSDA
jgi:hypothetical protein